MAGPKERWSDEVVGSLGQGLDWSTEWAEGEWEKLTSFYMKSTGVPDMDHVRFIPFMHYVRPDALKRYRLLNDAQRFRLGDVPDAARTLSALHHACVTGYAEGVFYSIQSSRTRGARKTHVADTLALAWIHANHQGMHKAAEAADDYMRAWNPDDDEGTPAIKWPAGWGVDPDAFRSGIDFGEGTSDLSPQDLKCLEEWHRRVQGEVPAYVPFLAKHEPVALKAFRARYENALQSSSLPKQMIAVLLLREATEWMRPDAMRRTFHMARYFGVTEAHVVRELVQAQLLRGDLGSDAGLQLVGHLLDAW